MKKLEMLLEGMYFVPQVVPDAQKKTIEALEDKGYEFANWIKTGDPVEDEEGKGAASLHKRTSKFSRSFVQVDPDGSINGEPADRYLAREDKVFTPVHMDEYALAMGIKPKKEMTTAGIPEDTSDTMGTTIEECWVRGKRVNIDSIELDEGEGDAAKAVKAHYVDGTPLTDEELDELNNPGKSTGVPNVKQQPDLVRGVPATVVGEAPAPAPAPTTTPVKPGTPTKPSTPQRHPLTPAPGISPRPRPKAEGARGDVQMFIAKRTKYKQ